MTKLIGIAVSALVIAQIDPTAFEVYKTVGDVKLKMNIFNPEGHKAGDKRPVIVFFFGGGWQGGSTKQFAAQARYFASRGLVAMTAEYRVYGQHKAKVADCVADAQSAIRWVRANAARLGVDPERIVSSGGSAGGHLAAAVGTLKSFADANEDTKISSRPNAMILFNPALDLRAEAFKTEADSKRYQDLSGRFGASAEDLSPSLHVKKGTPPAIIFHGKDDSSVPFAQAEAFSQAMRTAGNDCELAGYPGQMHGFFNFGRNDNKFFIDTTTKADRFLISLKYLTGEPNVEQFLSNLK